MTVAKGAIGQARILGRGSYPSIGMEGVGGLSLVSVLGTVKGFSLSEFYVQGHSLRYFIHYLNLILVICN